MKKTLTYLQSLSGSFSTQDYIYIYIDLELHRLVGRSDPIRSVGRMQQQLLIILQYNTNIIYALLNFIYIYLRKEMKN